MQENYKNYECNGDTDYKWCTWNNPQRLGKDAERFKNQTTSCDHPNCGIEIRQNTEKSCCHSNSSERLSTNTGMKNLHGVIQGG